MVLLGFGSDHGILPSCTHEVVTVMFSHTRTSFNIAVAISLICVSAGYCQEQSDPRPIPKTDTVCVAYWGEVVEITKKSITIQPPSRNLRPQTFDLSEALAEGRIPNTPRIIPTRPGGYKVSPNCMYRLKDVRVGDLVSIEYAKIQDRVICDHISIQKRPGGRVPPLPEEAEALRRPPPSPSGAPPTHHVPYHELMNAHWDSVERLPLAPPPREVIRPGA